MNNGTPFVLGFEFRADTNLTATALGFYDYLGDGLIQDHQIGLWDSGGSLLASTTVASGTVDPLTGHFRYHSIAPVSLIAGQLYTVGGLTMGEMYVYNPLGITTSGVTYINDVFANTATLVRPTASTDDIGWFGANVLAETAVTPVPEPGSMLLLGTGLAGLVARARRRKQKRS